VPAHGGNGARLFAACVEITSAAWSPAHQQCRGNEGGTTMPRRYDFLPRNNAVLTRRRFVAGTSAGLAGILATGRTPAFAQTAAKKLIYAHIVPAPESAAVHQAWMAEEVTKRSKGALAMEFHGGTLLSKELEIMNAVKAGNVA